MGPCLTGMIDVNQVKLLIRRELLGVRLGALRHKGNYNRDVNCLYKLNLRLCLALIRSRGMIINFNKSMLRLIKC